MAKEISFAEVVRTADTAGEIPFAEAAGPPVPQGPSIGQRISEGYQRFTAGSQAVSEAQQAGRRQLFTSAAGDLKPVAGEGFFPHAGKTALRGLRALFVSPSESAVGGAKALTSGVLSLGESAVAGIRGLGAGAGAEVARQTVGRLPMRGPVGAVGAEARVLTPLRSAVSEIESTMEEAQQLRQVAAQVAKVNLAPANEQEQAMEGLLALIPEGIAAAGDTVYEQTGSALAGAGTQAMLTLLTFNPELAAKVVSGPKNPSIKALGKLAIEDLPAAQSVASHIRKASPETAKKIDAEIKAAVKDPVAAGKAAVKRPGKPHIKLKAQPQRVITAEEAGVGLSEAAAEMPVVAPPKPVAKRAVEFVADEETGLHKVTSPVGEILAQENLGYLQIKRADVLEAERGKGHAQEMMQLLLEQAENRGLVLASDFSVFKDAQKVYAALKQKGFNVKENPNSVNPETGSRVSADPRVPVYEMTRAEPTAAKPSAPAVTSTVPAAEAAKVDQIFVSGPTLDSLPGSQFVKGKLTAWYEELIRNLNPEALGQKAKQAAAVLGNKIAEIMNRDSANHGLAADRIAFWERLTPQSIREFMKLYETGKPQTDPVLQKLDAYLRQRFKEIYQQDQQTGVKYDPIDNYLYHIFENGEKLADYFQAKYGVKWGDPAFTKDRAFDLYEEAVAAGYKPKFTNPEEILLARQHASDIAQMRSELLKDLESYGLAREKTKANPDPPKDGQYNFRRSPTGKGYWVESTADAILHNAFDTKSLWNMPGVRGDLFKGAMFLKNSTVPIMLSLSLFHPLHLLLGMDSAAAMTRLTKEMMVGGMSPVKWFGKWLEQMTLGSKGIPLWGIIDNPRVGFRLLKAYQGKIDPAKLTAADRTALQYMAEGGFVPEMAAHYRSNAIENFRKAIRQTIAEYNSGKGGLGRAAGPAAKTGFYSPFAIIDAMQYPMFRLWIPALKIASYLKDVQTALKVDPTLVADKGRRLLAFRKLSKSVDNRYGEMNYNTLFWNRMIKDIAVANTLSLGWNLGFLREYGGGAMDIGQAAIRKGKFAEKVKAGNLDRPLFVMFYTTQVMLYSGLLTWALTGKLPTDLIDYLYPKSGEVDNQGKEERLNTPFYPREFAAIAKHVEHEGVAPGLWHVISNKASGVVGMVKQWATGVNWMGQEVRDPNSSWHQQIRDTLGATLGDLEPISIEQLRKSERTTKDVVTAFSGFGKAPKYVTQTNTEAQISTLYRKYYAPQQTPYETALVSNDRRQLAQFFERDQMEEYDKLLDQMITKYDLTAKEQQTLVRNIMRRGTDYNPYLTMFERLTWQQQKRLLDEMDEAEREEYLPHANRQHLRYSYESPSTND